MVDGVGCGEGVLENRDSFKAQVCSLYVSSIHHYAPHRCRCLTIMSELDLQPALGCKQALVRAGVGVERCGVGSL